jgi:hypothetical protein
MELCAKQFSFADATDALAAASGAASERPISTAAQSNRSREASIGKQPPRDENNATGRSVFCHSERSRGTCFLRSSNLALKALQPMFRVVARPSRNRLDVTATPPLRIEEIVMSFLGGVQWIVF